MAQCCGQHQVGVNLFHVRLDGNIDELVVIDLATVYSFWNGQSQFSFSKDQALNLAAYLVAAVDASCSEANGEFSEYLSGAVRQRTGGR